MSTCPRVWSQPYCGATNTTRSACSVALWMWSLDISCLLFSQTIQTGSARSLHDRVKEWLAFEPWDFTSINSVTGGAPTQALPLPFLVATILAFAMIAYATLARWMRRVAGSYQPIVLAAIVLVGWFVLDSRWEWNLVRQASMTNALYGGKPWRERHLAADDAPLFSFVEKVRDKLPPVPSSARVFLVSDIDYLRGRGAYHLYPYNVFTDVRQNAMPPASALHVGDYLVVFQRNGVQFNPREQRLRWDGIDPIAAELLLVEGPNALFRIR